MNETGTLKTGRKTAGYSSVKLQAKRKRKAFEAIDRQVEYEALSVQERLTLAQSRRGESKREVARLQALLTKKGSNVNK